MLKRNIDLIVGSLFIFYFIIINFMSLLMFKYLFLILGLLCFIYHFIKKYLNKKCTLYKIVKGVICCVLIIFILVESIMVLYPKHDLDTKCDYIIVLGALVNKNKISQSLKERLDSCVEYLYLTHDNPKIIVSGGQGRGENISEASAMKSYLLYKGIDEKNIIMEDKSRTTKENFCFSKKIIEGDSHKKIENLNVKVITTDFHTLRSKIISKKIGYANTTFYTSSSNGALFILNYTREFFALICNIIFNC